MVGNYALQKTITLKKSSSKLKENKILAALISLVVLTFMFLCCAIIRDSIQMECSSKPLKSPLGNVK